MLTLYRRHLKGCSKASDRFYKRCACPMWVEGTANGTYLRRSLKTASWERATELSRIIEESDKPAETPERKDDPSRSFRLSPSTWRMQRRGNSRMRPSTSLKIQLRKQFLGWCKAEGYKLLKEFDLRAAQSFRASWTDGGLAKKKKQERLTGFFWFCIRAGWLTANPTDRLGRISVTQAPTDYFTRDEYEKLLDATYLYREGRGETIGGNNGTRIRALIMLMRWSGLRIRDAVTLERTRLINDNLLLYQAKTGTPVYVPLPPQVAEALRTLPDGPKPNPRYFFWSGNGLPKSVVADWQRSFRRVFKLAGLEKPDGSAKRCFPHMLRDTFAVEMLLAGVPIDQVSMLLGHASVKITEKHYSPWVKARQDQLAASVRNAWGPLGAIPPQTPKRGRAKLMLMRA